MYRGRPYVYLSIPPRSGQLDCWGLDVGGEWWALIVWGVRVTPPGGGTHHTAGCAAWAPGRRVELRGQPVEYLHVPRIRLGAEPAEWPPPRDRPEAAWSSGAWYLGILDGSDPQLPPQAGTPWGTSQGSAYG
jgi:hypothetical protein